MTSKECEVGGKDTQDPGCKDCQLEILTVEKIEEFASKHSDDREDAERLRSGLVRLLLEIVSYCCLGKVCGFLPVMAACVEATAVLAIEECLRVSVRMGDAEVKLLFKRETPKDKVENQFLRLLDGCAFLAAYTIA